MYYLYFKVSNFGNLKYTIMPQQKLNVSSVEPVFILAKNLPDKVDIISMCAAGERVVGTSGIEGAYQDGGLWRIYPMSTAGRVMLLSKGLSLFLLSLFLFVIFKIPQKEENQNKSQNLPSNKLSNLK